MEIDPDISNWVLEFLLRQPIDDKTLNPLLSALPLSPNPQNQTLQKLILLKTLESDLSRSSLSEHSLQLLEQLEEIEFREGGTVSNSMKRAYCAIAVDCTVKLLLGNVDSVGKFGFFEAVKRVWRGRVGRMEKVLGNGGGLCSEELLVWKDEIEAAVWEDGVCESVVRKSEGVDVGEAVGEYLREERGKMGPSFLEVLAERVKGDEVLEGFLSGRSCGERFEGGKEAALGGDRCEGVKELALGGDHVAGVKEVALGGDRFEGLKEAALGGVDVSNGRRDIHKGKIPLRNKLIGSKRSRGLASGNGRGAKIVDSDDGVGPSNGNYQLPRSAEVNRVREALETSSLELKAVVKDPLPDALQFAETISGSAKETNNHDPVEENHFEDNPFVVDGAGVVQNTKPNTSDAPKPSLMERNNSACTLEWDESIDGSHGAPENCRTLVLSSPRILNISPLHRYEIKNLKKRRKGRRWSTLEEDTLRDGVQKYGKGNWKLILTQNREIFEDRTEVDLKDKWRNLTR